MRIAVTRTLAVFALLLAMAAPPLAFSKDGKTAEDCNKYLTTMSKDLDTLEALVPNVPPDEASYIGKEYSAAIEASLAVTDDQGKAGIRIYKVEHRPFFPAWNLHNAFDDARQELKLSQQSIHTDLIFQIKMASRIPYKMANAKITWNEFENADENGEHILAPKQVGLGSEISEGLIGTPGLYIWCLATALEKK